MNFRVRSSALLSLPIVMNTLLTLSPSSAAPSRRHHGLYQRRPLSRKFRFYILVLCQRRLYSQVRLISHISM